MVFAFVTLEGSFCSDTTTDNSRAGSCMLRFNKLQKKNGHGTIPTLGGGKGEGGEQEALQKQKPPRYHTQAHFASLGTTLFLFRNRSLAIALNVP